LLVGGLPAWQTSKLTPGVVLRTEPRGAIGSVGQVRSGRLLVSAQLALSLPLLVGAGLLVQTVFNLQRMNLGLSSARMVLLRLTLQSAGSDITRRARVARDLLDTIAIADRGDAAGCSYTWARPGPHATSIERHDSSDRVRRQ
jgi:hypothetical protein